MSDERRRISYWRGEEILRNAIGETFKLQGNGRQLFSFSLESKRALDLELRIQPLASNIAGAALPLWRYKLEIGHGDAIARSVEQVPGFPLQDPQIPHRGLLTRLSSRELRVTVWLDSVLGGELAGAVSEILISAQPSFGAVGWPSITYQDASDVEALRRFPIEAREFRARQWNDGLSIPIGTVNLGFLALNGFAVAAATDAALFLDWTPIPVNAAFWVADASCGMEYR
jgi:hypothetical protein